MSEYPEWDRAWRHDELDRAARMAADPRFRARETIKLFLFNAVVLVATVALGWSLVRFIG